MLILSPIAGQPITIAEDALVEVLDVRCHGKSESSSAATPREDDADFDELFVDLGENSGG